MTCRKLLVLPIIDGHVTFSTHDFISIDMVNIHRENIVGRQPEKGEHVIVLDIQDLIDALRAGDDELADTEINGTVVRLSKKAAWIRLDGGREVSLPLRFIDAEIDDYVRTARLPRWLALDRGL